MALWAISYFCTVPILFSKLKGFPGKKPWGLPVTPAITKSGLWSCGLGLNSSLISAAQAMSEDMRNRSVKGSRTPSREASLAGRAVAQHLPQRRFLVKCKKMLKAEFSELFVKHLASYLGTFALLSSHSKTPSLTNLKGKKRKLC